MPKTKIQPRETRFHPLMQYMTDLEAIQEDEKTAGRKDLRGSNYSARERLKKDSEVGRYASPELDANDIPLGDVGQFLKKGGKVKGYAKGGKIDGCAQRGKTKGRYI